MITVLAIALAVVVGGALLALVVGVWRFRRTLSTVRTERPDDVWEAAFLAGGPGRVADLALYALHADWRIRVGDPGVVIVEQPVARHPVESEVLAAHARSPHGGLGRLRGEVMRSATVQGIGDRLAERGLMVRPAVIRHWRRRARTLAFTCLALAFLVLVLSLGGLGDSVGSTLGALLPSLAVGFVGGLVCVVAVGGRLTPAGEAAFFTYASTTGSEAGDGIPATMNRIAAKGPREISGKLRTLLQKAARTGYAAPLVAGGAAAVAVPAVMEVTWCGSAPGESARAGAAGGGGSSGGAGCGTGSCGAGAGGGDAGCGGSGGGCGGGGGGCGGGCGGCGGCGG
ncbi:TIGR04222 domain-containing membrane protein [Streptomyces sp. 71268]|uniref:TIGR04222 domain-containing membrane protein n=1 Tax=Streptomyces sp. 71268 TaxID=3002640 RepID=UPI0023F830E4|nr:TIGR04222 domain-containing membrane protein [Streptomyces sp. 71268]WEV24840.1 TIGR04222 domain-containing membrane protein [Streptomyces sp. 71268]